MPNPSRQAAKDWAAHALSSTQLHSFAVQVWRHMCEYGMHTRPRRSLPARMRPMLLAEAVNMVSVSTTGQQEIRPYSG